MLLGLWGAVIPFVGPSFSFGFTPDEAWTWTSGRGWLEVLPGAVTVVGGCLILVSRHRAVAALGAWLACAAGAWFIVGPTLAEVANTGSPGSPTGDTLGMVAVQQIAYFYGLGAVILFLGATALGRMSVRSVRDYRRAEGFAPTDGKGSPPAAELPKSRRLDDQRSATPSGTDAETTSGAPRSR
ncbi:hypothetical protein [Rhodococcus spelaei]|uniref:hypothetical protein n=1 Tax=Rhodococcus spelaei TaxID=2546320 RepID=UPI0015EE9710|nr:hypothetical protein [Rhodococcus spelaei]